MSEAFNNLSKVLRLNLYNFAVGRTSKEKRKYAEHIRKEFSLDRVANLLGEVSNLLGTRVVNISKFEQTDPAVLMNDSGSVNLHLDKSHICAQTYLDVNDPNGICTFRADVDISICGSTNPLYALEFLVHKFPSNDVVVADYTVRGFSRNGDGTREMLDQDMESLTDYLDPNKLSDFQWETISDPFQRTWQAKFLRLVLKPSDYLMDGKDPKDSDSQALQHLEHEMRLIYHG